MNYTAPWLWQGTLLQFLNLVPISNLQLRRTLNYDQSDRYAKCIIFLPLWMVCDPVTREYVTTLVGNNGAYNEDKIISKEHSALSKKKIKIKK